jgi:ABC-2 type transport system permease protein
MSAMTLLQGPAAGATRGSGMVAFGRLLRSEWTKIWSVRSTAWSLAILVIGGIGLSAVIDGVTAAHWATVSAADRQAITVKGAFGAGLDFAQLPMCVLGVLVITSEYGTGMIRSSLLAVPRREHLLAAKAAVFGAVAFAAGELLAFGCIPIGQALLGSRVPESLSDPANLRAAFGVGLYLAALGLFAFAVGALVRHTAGAITAVIVIFVALGDLSQLIPGTVGKYVNAYMPANAGILVTNAHQRATDLLSPWQGLGVLCLWAAILLAVAGILLARRDA